MILLRDPGEGAPIAGVSHLTSCRWMMIVDQVIKEAAIAALAADSDGLVSHVNDRFEVIFGWKRDEIVGRPISTIIPKRLRDAHNLGFSRFLLTAKPTILGRPLLVKAVTKGGLEFDVEQIIRAERCDGRWVFGATIRPIDGSGRTELEH